VPIGEKHACSDARAIFARHIGDLALTSVVDERTAGDCLRRFG
jgi:hypothetical protein